MHPNQADPVDDDAYPGVIADDGTASTAPPAGWDRDPALAATQRCAADHTAEPDDAWAALCALDSEQGDR
jgi:hypothetical protein